LPARSSGGSARWSRRTDRPCSSTRFRACRSTRRRGCSTCSTPGRSCRWALATREVDVRVIAASDGRLLEAVEAGRFREDLYYKLNTVHVAIPPLRDRADDARARPHLLDRIAQQPGLRWLGITEDALDLLRRYDWPGNVRQLQNALFRAAVLCEGDVLNASDFPQIASLGDRPSATTGAANGMHNGGINLFRPDGNLRPLEDIEADVIRLAIGHYRGRMTEVARRLGIGRSTLYRKLGELGIDNAA
jgi:DNA-binding NtrC family response regulator